MINLIKTETDYNQLNTEKIKLGSWLNRLSLISYSKSSKEDDNQIGWEKAVFILFWNARVRKLNTYFPKSGVMKPIVFCECKSTNALNEGLNEAVLQKNDLLKKIVLSCLEYESFDLKTMYKKIYAVTETKTVTPPTIFSLLPLFQMVQDFKF